MSQVLWSVMLWRLSQGSHFVNDGMSQCWERGVRLVEMAGFVCLEQHMFKHSWCLNVNSFYQLSSVRNYNIDISAIQMCNLLYVEWQ